MKERLIFPDGYKSRFSRLEISRAVRFIKDEFEKNLERECFLEYIPSPLFFRRDSGINDNLNGFERPVSFDLLESPMTICEISQSIAKWKRLELSRLGLRAGEGIWSEVNATRRDEITDNIHSLLSDQWGWEVIIEKKDKTEEFLESFVRKIYSVIKETEKAVSEKFGISESLPEEIKFISAPELEEEYPELPARQREKEIAKKYGAVFISKIGGKLQSGGKHDGRAPDIDDWELNGDIVVFYPLLDCAFELSSMGIRVGAEKLSAQCTESGCEERLEHPYHMAITEGLLPESIGGEIGISRLCMFLLGVAHIGEVCRSVWQDSDIALCRENGIKLL